MPDPDSPSRLPAARFAAILFAALCTSIAVGCSAQGKSGSGQDQANKEAAGPTPAKIGDVPLGHGFDFYVLSLSWSPTWCMDNDADGRSEQCREGRNAGFIVHGLWPQNERSYPEFCRTRESDRVPASLGKQYLDIIPSMGLIGHQWRKHGSCSGLSQSDYLAVTRAALEGIVIPDALEDTSGERLNTPDIEAALIKANPGMTARGVAVTCDAGRLEEIRICLTPGLSFRECPDVDRAGCKVKSITQPPIR